MKFTIAACDDSKIFMNKLVCEVNRVIDESHEECRIIKCFDGTELVSQCLQEPVDIILVDIDMPKLDGFTAVSRIQKYRPDIIIIFVTSHTEKAYQSFEYRPYWFISKSDISNMGRVLPGLLKKLKQEKENHTVFSLYIDGHVVNINTEDTIYFESFKHYIIVHNGGSQDFKFRGTINDVYRQAKAFWFVRIQSGLVVNCRFIQKITSRYVLLKNMEQFNMTRNTARLNEAQITFSNFMRARRW